MREHLKQAIEESHREAERHRFVDLLKSGEMPDQVFAEFLINQQACYGRIELYAQEEGLLEGVEGISRSIPIKKHLDSLDYDPSKVALTSSTKRYTKHIDQLAKTEPRLLLGHIYARYFGDLYGGQFLATKAPGNGSFYAFDSPMDLIAGVSKKLTADLDEEANAAIRFNIELFEELSVKHGIESSIFSQLDQFSQKVRAKFFDNYRKVEDAGYSWESHLFVDSRFRRAGLDILDMRDTKKFYMIHICIFPNVWDPSPIFGFDVVAGPKKVTGIFHDFSPTNPSDSMLSWFSSRVEESGFGGEKRQLPEWATNIFSDSIVALSQISDELHLASVLEFAYENLEHYLDNVGVVKVEDYTDQQNWYCQNQKKNQHTYRSLLSLGVAQDDVDFYVDKHLFPEIISPRENQEVSDTLKMQEILQELREDRIDYLASLIKDGHSMEDSVREQEIKIRLKIASELQELIDRSIRTNISSPYISGLEAARATVMSNSPSYEYDPSMQEVLFD